MKKLSKILIISLATLTVAGCGKIPTLENGEEAVVTTSKGSISANELYEKLKESYGRDALIEMIDKLILSDKYKETDDEKTYIEEQIKQFKEAATNSNVSYEYVLNYYGFDSEDELKEYARLNYRRDLAVKDYLKDKLSDKEINDYYKNNIYGDINVKHILIAPEVLDGMTSEEKTKAEEKALSTAKEVIKKLNDGAKWSDLVKEYSDDSKTKSKDGDLGWFNVGEMQEDFEDKAFALKKGEYTSTPAKTSYGYHVILKVDEKAKPSLKDATDDIKTELVANKLSSDSTLYYKTLENIRNDAELKIIDSSLNKKYKSYMSELKTSKN